MADPRYDIFFKGEVLDGTGLDQAKANVAQLFKTDPAKVDKLFSGKVVALKRGLDKVTAAKFKQALEKAGVKIYIKHAAEEASVVKTEASSPPPLPQSDNDDARPPLPEVHEDNSPPPLPQVEEANDIPVNERGMHDVIEDIELDVLPPGSDVLTEDEREIIEAPDIDTSSIMLESTFAIRDEPPAPPPAPDVSHISAAAPGAVILEGYEPEPPPPPPDVSHLTAAEAGAPLEQLKEEKEVVIPDIDHITVAEPGADIDPTEKEPPPPPPDVSHIKISE